MTEFKRLFVAVSITPNSNFIELLNNLKKEFVLDKITWTRKENIHFTLCFIGETAEYLLPQIKTQLSIVCENALETTILLSRLGYFGPSYQPKILWLGINPENSFRELYFDIHKKLAAIGIQTVLQNYVPHITLGRIYSLLSKKHFYTIIENHRNTDIQIIKVDSICLYESILSKIAPPVYNEIASFPLQH